MHTNLLLPDSEFAPSRKIDVSFDATQSSYNAAFMHALWVISVLSPQGRQGQQPQPLQPLKHVLDYFPRRPRCQCPHRAKCQVGTGQGSPVAPSRTSAAAATGDGTQLSVVLSGLIASSIPCLWGSYFSRALLARNIVFSDLDGSTLTKKVFRDIIIAPQLRHLHTLIVRRADAAVALEIMGSMPKRGVVTHIVRIVDCNFSSVAEECLLDAIAKLFAAVQEVEFESCAFHHSNMQEMSRTLQAQQLQRGAATPMQMTHLGFDTCRGLNSVGTLSAILRAAVSCLVSIKIRNCNLRSLGNEATLGIAAALRSVSSEDHYRLTALDLSLNSFEKNAALDVLAVLASPVLPWKALQHVDLSGATLSGCGRELSKWVSGGADKLTELRLCMCNLQVDDIHQLMCAVKGTRRSWKVLDVSFNGLVGSEVRHVTNAVSRMGLCAGPLLELSVSGMDFSAKAVHQHFSSCLHLLRVLDLRWCRLGAKGVSLLCGVIQRSSARLEVLDLSGSRIAEDVRARGDAMISLSKMLKSLPTCTHLHVADNGLQDAPWCFAPLTVALSKYSTANGCFWLDMSRNPLFESGSAGESAGSFTGFQSMLRSVIGRQVPFVASLSDELAGAPAAALLISSWMNSVFEISSTTSSEAPSGLPLPFAELVINITSCAQNGGQFPAFVEHFTAPRVTLLR